MCRSPVSPGRLALPADDYTRPRPIAGLLAAVIGGIGLLAGLCLPFVPVWAEQTTVSWPAAGALPISTTAFLTPYRPMSLTATVPCALLRSVGAAANPTTVLATASDGDGLLVRVAGGTTRVLVNGKLVATADTRGAGCGAAVRAGPLGVRLHVGERTASLPGEPVPVVQQFATDLTGNRAWGLRVSARTQDPFSAHGTGTKWALIAAQLLAAAIAFGWLCRRGPGWAAPGAHRGPARAWARRPRYWLDLAMAVVLAGWAIIGPLSDDDGFATTIARNSYPAGYQGNYYRWWNASETPFALAQHVLAPLTRISLDPLWLRGPSTALAVVTWVVLSRAVLPAAVPELARGGLVRLLAAVCFLAAWLPFNLGVRPEAYVAAGLTGVLALLWRARTLRGVAGAALVAAVAVSASPSGLLLAAPILVFAPKIVRIVRAGAVRRLEVLGRVLLLGAVAAVALTAVFADQSWHALAVATRWHEDFGPSLPWYAEVDRYQYLMGSDQDGSATKRVPVLLSLALLPVVGLLLARGTAAAARIGTARLAGVTTLALLLFWFTPSKWSHHFGALAGVFAAFLAAAVVFLAQCARSADRGDRVALGVGLGGTLAVALAAGLIFNGPNAWWQPTSYLVPWAGGPIRPAGVPLYSPLLWLAAAAVGYLAARRRRGPPRAGGALIAAPAALATGVCAVSVAVLLVSFVSAPIRHPLGSLAVSNVAWLTRRPTCGLADSVRVLPDVPGAHLVPVPGAAPSAIDGFVAGGGFAPDAPPPEPVGTGGSSFLWGSRSPGALTTGELTSQWYVLPALAPDEQVAVSVAGRTDGGNRLALRFGRAVGSGVRPLGEVVPPDPVPGGNDGPKYRYWRAIGVGPADVPARADRVRIEAVDATADPNGWLAVTGPRLRRVMGLAQYLDQHRPYLVAWPVAFLFPCLTDSVAVSDGLAQAPAGILEAPDQYAGLSSVTTDPASGGDFAPLRTLGHLGEETNELVGHPGADWGNVLLPHYEIARDRYQRHTEWVRVSGFRALTG